MNFNSRYLEGIWNHLGVSLWHSTEVEGKSTVPFCFNQIWILFASTKCKYGYMDVFKSTSVGNHDDKMLIYFTICLSLFTCNISDSYCANRQMNSILYILFSSHCCLGCRVFWQHQSVPQQRWCHSRVPTFLSWKENGILCFTAGNSILHYQCRPFLWPLICCSCQYLHKHFSINVFCTYLWYFCYKSIIILQIAKSTAASSTLP